VYSRILVPVDGSDLAQHAVHWAERLVAGRPAELFLLQAVQPLAGVFTARPTLPLLAAAKFEERREMRAATEALSNQIHALHGRGLSASRYVQVGRPALQILKFIQQHTIDLVVMGTHGRGGVPRAILGSVADEVRREAPVPVLVVPHDDVPIGETSILICLDQSTQAESALHAGAELAATLRASVVLFEVTEGLAESISALEYLQNVAKDLGIEGVQATTVTGRGDPGPTILLHADIMRASVIAMASHGRSGLARAVLGSVATHVLAHSHVPVLLTRRMSTEPQPRHSEPELTRVIHS
jgi:nucleotide-binding universal stress UspA family protein